MRRFGGEKAEWEYLDTCGEFLRLFSALCGSHAEIISALLLRRISPQVAEKFSACSLQLLLRNTCTGQYLKCSYNLILTIVVNRIKIHKLHYLLISLASMEVLQCSLCSPRYIKSTCKAVCAHLHNIDCHIKIVFITLIFITSSNDFLVVQICDMMCAKLKSHIKQNVAALQSIFCFRS